MKFKKNLTAVAQGIIDEDMLIDFDDSRDPHEFPPWYTQFLKLPEKKRLEMVNRALEKVKAEKPETYSFIDKFSCELVGVTPRIEYALCKSSEGDLDVTWVHGYALVTLLYWCADGGFGFFVNANLEFNDTVLNKVKGNEKQKLKGFTS